MSSPNSKRKARTVTAAAVAVAASAVSFLTTGSTAIGATMTDL